jgi:O-antigen/teichoic acid export membrane protein
VTAVTLVIQVAAALWLIPRFGVVAAAWLTVAVEWLAVGLLWGRITLTDDTP